MKLGPFSASVGRRYAWFRVLGYGLSVRSSKAFPPLFSERAGKRKVLRCMGLAVEALRPTPSDRQPEVLK